MRKRHTSRTDELMAGDKVSVTFRLSKIHRDALLDASKRGMADCHSLSDILQDAVWMWLYEDEKINGKQAGALRNRVRADANKSVDPETGEAGLAQEAETPEVVTGSVSEDSEVRVPVAG